MSRIAVIGAGVIGLSTAINIQQRIPESHVTLVADKFNENTTSDGAGAIIVPWSPGLSEDIRRKWGQLSMDYFTQLAVSESSSECGASICMGIILTPTPEPPIYKEQMLTCNTIPRSTLEKLHLNQYYGHAVTSVCVHMRKYLVWLLDRFKKRGGVVVNRRVHSFQEFLGTHDVVVNCTGMEARQLMGDEKVIPVRGQTLRVSAPWIKHFIKFANITMDIRPYFYPNADNVIIGGTTQAGNFDLTVDPQTSKKIWNKATSLWPPLKSAKLQWEWVGLRPHREPPRVESELIRYGDKTLQVVHNYGHGSTGVSLSWGSAILAAELAKKMVETKSKL